MISFISSREILQSNNISALSYYFRIKFALNSSLENDINFNLKTITNLIGRSLILFRAILSSAG